MIRLSEIKIFTGVSPYAPQSVVRLTYDFGKLAGAPASRLKKSFGQRVPGILNEFLERYRDSGFSSGNGGRPSLRHSELSHPELLLNIILYLQEMVRSEPNEGHVIDGGQDGLRQLAVLFEDHRVTQKAGELAAEIVSNYLPQEFVSKDRTSAPIKLEEEIDKFVQFGNDVLNQEYGLVRRAARRLDVPWIGTTRAHSVLGVGKYRKFNLVSVTGDVSKLGHDLVHNKTRANAWLRWNGFPVTRQEPAREIEDAVRVAKAIGYPVCVKPQFGGGGKCVSTGLTNESQVREAYRIAKKQFREIVVENFLEGDDHRLLVSDGEVVAAVKKVLPFIVGDGRSSIAELLDALNADPQRDGIRLVRIDVDDELDFLMNRSGYDLKTVLPSGETFTLRMASNWVRGSTISNVVDIVHPEIRRFASRINKCVGVDPLGIDYITIDISRPNREVGGAILDLNQMPGLRLHELVGQDVSTVVIRSAFPKGAPSRGPTALVFGVNQSRSVTLVLNHLLSMAGFTVGLIFKDTYFVGGEFVQQTSPANHGIIRNIVVDERIEAVVHEIDAAKLSSIGSGHNWMDVSIVTDLPGTEDPRSALLSQCVRSATEASTKFVVLDGDCSSSRAAVAEIDPSRICYVCRHEAKQNSPAGNVHEQGVRVIVDESPQSGRLVCRENGDQHVLVELAEIPALRDDQDSGIAKTVAMGAAAALGLGVPVKDLQFGLRKLSSCLMSDPLSLFMLPGLHCRTLIALSQDIATALRHLYVLSQGGNSSRSILFVAITNQVWPFASRTGDFDAPLIQAIDDYVGKSGRVVVAQPAEFTSKIETVLESLGSDDELTVLTDDPEQIRKILEFHKRS